MGTKVFKDYLIGLLNIFVTVIISITVKSQSFDSIYSVPKAARIQSVIPIDDRGFAALGYQNLDQQTLVGQVFIMLIDSIGNMKAKVSYGSGYGTKQNTFLKTSTGGYVFYRENRNINPEYSISSILILSPNLTILKIDQLLLTEKFNTEFIRFIKVFELDQNIYLFASVGDDGEDGVNRSIYRKYNQFGAKIFEMTVDSCSIADVVEADSLFYLLISSQSGSKIQKMKLGNELFDLCNLSNDGHEPYGVLGLKGDTLIATRIKGRFPLPSEVYCDINSIDGQVIMSKKLMEKQFLSLSKPLFMKENTITHYNWSPPIFQNSLGRLQIYENNLLNNQNKTFDYNFNFANFDGDSIRSAKISSISGANSVILFKGDIFGDNQVFDALYYPDSVYISGLQMLENGYFVYGSIGDQPWIRVDLEGNNELGSDGEAITLSNYSVYPNPGQGIYFVRKGKSSYKGKIEIRESLGKLVGSKYINDGLLDIVAYPNGIYFVNLDSPYGKQIKLLKLAD